MSWEDRPDNTLANKKIRDRHGRPDMRDGEWHTYDPSFIKYCIEKLDIDPMCILIMNFILNQKAGTETSERFISNGLGISQSTVHKALIRLSKMGTYTISKGRGGASIYNFSPILRAYGEAITPVIVDNSSEVIPPGIGKRFPQESDPITPGIESDYSRNQNQKSDPEDLQIPAASSSRSVESKKNIKELLRIQRFRSLPPSHPDYVTQPTDDFIDPYYEDINGKRI